MSVLILKNVRNEGPGTIENFLLARAVPYSIADCQTDGVPVAPDADTLVIMGGPMSVNEAGVLPYIADEIALAAEYMKKGKKVLGICLGAQVMAKALGARVYPGPEKEIGWYDLELVDAGLSDPLLKLLSLQQGAGGPEQGLRVFHWHGETFDIPEGAGRLAASALYPNQAFKYGDRAYAFQFHIEVTPEMIREWLMHEPVDYEKIARETGVWYDDYAGRAMKFYEAFFNTVV